ncbi:hypothetical protein RchiOBHm_Chr2g0116431 [Rosa chinensis]|uniref:Uncharacterized protein n=1 Tax=Rosa chinensis TaxID=74649 RepID=A0A2P6RRB6_ROSCH|nr:hypothetical protein RchiOBHm_Chr2g0116431 [Rosa chinensis]
MFMIYRSSLRESDFHQNLLDLDSRIDYIHLQRKDDMHKGIFMSVVRLRV